MLKKTGMLFKKKSLFQIHEILVASSETENRLSRKIDSLLNRKFRDEAETCLGLGESEFMECWDTRFETGDFKGILWCAAINQRLKNESKIKIFGDIHMATHCNSEQRGKLNRTLSMQHEKMTGIRRKMIEAGRGREIQKIIKAVPDPDMKRCNASCPSFNLCKKRILMIGGFTRMKPFYRQLIEGSGGVFEYHDGYMKKGVRSLKSRFRRADIVLCAISCNSHAACSTVKKLGKKHKKSVHMLDRFSLSAVSHVIRTEGNEGLGISA